MWFETLTGFVEQSPEQVRENIAVDGETMFSKVNGRKMACGRLDTPTLADLRAQAQRVNCPKGPLKLSEVVADVQHLHTLPENCGALFQVASQFNLLEMVSSSVTPEDGVGIYEHDRTQGPACAIACGAGTIYRNYFVEVNENSGQSAVNQLDCLRDLGDALGNADGRLWRMQNGYALASAEGLNAISSHLTSIDEAERDRLRQMLRIGIQWNTQVTLARNLHSVSQAYCSALPVAYSMHSADAWSDFAQLVLEAAYEATLYAGIVNWSENGSNRLFLTLLGGGAFGNRDSWILAAIGRALRVCAEIPLDVSIVSYGSSTSHIQRLIKEWP
mgnify:FL=1